jgi:hypothetical protein
LRNRFSPRSSLSIGHTVAVWSCGERRRLDAQPKRVVPVDDVSGRPQLSLIEPLLVVSLEVNGELVAREPGDVVLLSGSKSVPLAFKRVGQADSFAPRCSLILFRNPKSVVRKGNNAWWRVSP